MIPTTIPIQEPVFSVGLALACLALCASVFQLVLVDSATSKAYILDRENFFFRRKRVIEAARAVFWGFVSGLILVVIAFCQLIASLDCKVRSLCMPLDKMNMSDISAAVCATPELKWMLGIIVCTAVVFVLACKSHAKCLRLLHEILPNTDCI